MPGGGRGIRQVLAGAAELCFRPLVARHEVVDAVAVRLSRAEVAAGGVPQGANEADATTKAARQRGFAGLASARRAARQPGRAITGPDGAALWQVAEPAGTGAAAPREAGASLKANGAGRARRSSPENAH